MEHDQGIGILIILTVVIVSFTRAVTAEAPPNRQRVLGVARQMASSFQGVEDYTCDVETTYYRDGMEDAHWRFKFYYTKKKKVRVDFSDPYPGMTILYGQGHKKATVIPFRFFPALKFDISIQNPIMKTPAGQRLDQTHMGYFIDFLFKSLKKVRQKDSDFREEPERITFLLWALDYINWDTEEKYRIVISKKNWFPIRIERYHLDGKPMEISHIKNYSVNSHLAEDLFQSR